MLIDLQIKVASLEHQVSIYKSQAVSVNSQLWHLKKELAEAYLKLADCYMDQEKSDENWQDAIRCAYKSFEIYESEFGRGVNFRRYIFFPTSYNAKQTLIIERWPFRTQRELGVSELSVDPEISFLLGVRYLCGIGVAQDIENGISALEVAAKRGWTPAQYFFGVVIASVQARSNVYLNQAVEKGYAPAQYAKGLVLDDMQLIEKSAAQGYSNAQYNRGISSSNWDDVEKAASQGLDKAQYSMGKHCADIDDHLSAHQWYRKAVSQGHVRAKDALQEMYMRLLPATSKPELCPLYFVDHRNNIVGAYTMLKQTYLRNPDNFKAKYYYHIAECFRTNYSIHPVLISNIMFCLAKGKPFPLERHLFGAELYYCRQAGDGLDCSPNEFFQMMCIDVK